MIWPPRSESRGSSLVEVLISFAVVGTAMLVMLQQLSLSYRETGVNEQRVFAYQRALAILAELQAGIERGSIPDTEALDTYSDRGSPNFVLTTLLKDGSPVPPDHAMSGNRRGESGEWVWQRLVDIEPIAKQQRMRFVRIRLVHVDIHGSNETLATVSSVLSGPPKAFPPTQVHDVYLISVAEAPALWRTTTAVRDAMETARAQLASGNPNLAFKFHWITKFGYGRNPCYVPYINASDLATAATPLSYWYPGAIASGTDHDVLYSQDTISGRVRTEAGIQHDYDATTNPSPHAVADQWNHCMRYPEAKSLFDARVLAGLEDPAAPPLQILLEDMCANPGKYRNAIFVNCHGSGLPCPPLRNYSDAAKDDVTYPGVRVVTHPAKLRPARDPDGDGLHVDTENCELRVHAYGTDPAGGGPDSVREITVEIPGVNLSLAPNAASGISSLDIRCLPGGFDTSTGVASNSVPYWGFETAQGLPQVGVPGPTDYAPAFTVSYAGGSTWIHLYNTPFRAPAVGTQGLAAGDRLYGLEYVPSPVLGDFARDLATAGAFPKNTARWRIRVPKAIYEPSFPGGTLTNVDRVVKVRTCIGTRAPASTVGTMWPASARNAPENLSTTYAWWGNAADDVPVTERSQILGDPRHNPYADLCTGGTSWPDGYSWYFQDLQTPSASDVANYPCLDAAKLRDGFVGGVLADVPRAMAIWRQALLATRGVCTHLGGALCKHVLFGGEIAVPAATPGADLGKVALNGTWFGDTGPIQVDTLTNGDPAAAAPGPGGARIGAHLLASSTGNFWVKAWLGELCPVSAAATWIQNGNVECGTGLSRLQRSVLAFESGLPDLPRGTHLAVTSGGTIGDRGLATFLQAGSSVTKSAIAQYEVGPTGSFAKQTPAAEIAKAAGMTLNDAVTGPFPFRLDRVLAYPDAQLPPHLDPLLAASYPACTLAPMEAQPLFAGPTVAGATTLGAAGLRFHADPVGVAAGQGPAYATLLAMAPKDAEEHSQLAQAALVLPLRALHAAGIGNSIVGTAVCQLPRVEIVEPQVSASYDSPSSILLRWRVTWKRFDGADYTPDYASAPGMTSAFANWESQLSYVILYSTDQGTTWKYVQDHQPALLLARPASTSLTVVDAAAGDESYLIATNDLGEYPAGDVLFRVEAFSTSRETHVSTHQVKVSVLR